MRPTTALAIALLFAGTTLLYSAQPADAVKLYCTLREPTCPGWVCVYDLVHRDWICVELCDPCPYPGLATRDGSQVLA
jgi:hypothetical protein